MSISNEILGEEKNVQLPPQFTLKIEPYSSKAQGKKCASDISREERDLQPAHFTLKMESYSSVLDALEGKEERYETGSFDAGGYKCNPFPTDNWTVCVNFKLFVLNQKTNKYLTIQDAKGAVRYYDKLRTEHGYAQLLSLDKFNDPCNGYLVNDCCVFGAEVLVIQPSSGNEETINMVKELDERTYTWSITNFSKSEKSQYSGDFRIGGRKWKLKFYPKGNKSQKGKSLSLYLWLADWESVEPKRKVYAKYKLRVLDHSEVNTIEKPASKWFDSKTGQGYHDFIPLDDIYELSNGYLKNDTLILEVEFDVISAIKVRP
ncbi:hypothetical protein ACOSP7_004428 [Xanthoceras sorbifolium]|uniref:MATH domain-containing protein n=1 Tax=Xanthoceras sorbifolium TaxID=99658 RepID=A0ABQ8IGA5_9ROSI|nr:hypothetical protein JRO89_XS02G0195700 [Xanthoceras sorbifolium]